MNAVAMVTRCFERQWAGLEEGERRWIERRTAPEYISGYPNEVPRAHMQWIWRVSRVPESEFDPVRAGDCLMSMKMD